MYLVSPQTFGFNAIDSFHVPVEDPSDRVGKGYSVSIFLGLIFTGPCPHWPLESATVFTSKIFSMVIKF